jgi:hypothetical protein
MADELDSVAGLKTDEVGTSILFKAVVNLARLERQPPFFNPG